MSEDSGSTQRSKRQVSKQLSTRLSALDRLKNLKGAKNKYEITEENDVYETVNEDEYCDLVLKRQKDDWIVDDDGQGYNDNGREIFDDDFDDEQINDNRNHKSNDRKKVPLNRYHNEDERNRKKKKNDLPNMFKNMETNKKTKSINDVTINEKELEDLVDPSKSSASISSVYGKTGRSMSTSTPMPLKLDKRQSKSINSNPFATTPKSNTNSLTKRTNSSFMTPYPKKRLLNSTKELDFDSILEPSDIAEINNQKQTNKLTAKIVPNTDDNNKKTVTTNETLNSCLSEGEWLSSKNDIQSMSMPTVLPKELPFVTDSQNNKCIKFYWFDAHIDYFKNPGVVYLFGKVWIKELNRHVSCCIQVKNIERRIYLLPREHFLNDSSRKVTLQDVYNEFNDDIAKRYKITQFRSRKVTKRYAFEIPDVPEEAEYLEVLYSANFAALPSELTSGNTFRQVFGVTANGLENLILDCKLKGPNWLLIKNPVLCDPPVSWCKIELIVNKANAQIVVDSEQTDSPDFTLLSLNLRTYLHPISKNNEIIAISCLVNRSFSFNKPNSKIKYDSHFCVFSKPSTNSGLVLPYDFTTNMAIKRYTRTKIDIMNSERELLNYFMAKLLQLDPDIIVGHDIYHFDYDLILSRFSYHKLSMSWSKLGRLKRSGIPNKAKDKNSICGRLVCDIKISSKELIRAKSYDLTHLSSQILRKGRFEIGQQMLPQFYSTSDQLFRLIDLTMKDNEMILYIMYELNALPLALQITNIAGNLLSRTLLGGRSERNEYLLLHAFHEKNFICPNKVFNNAKVHEVDNDNYDDAVKSSNKAKSSSRQRKAAYTGGLVLEPKVGFYDKFILLMDFLSLYPSIIQEFNICFTTVRRHTADKEKDNDEDSIPDIPDSNLNEGILPNEIKKLVNSRREVKKLMCDPELSPELKQQYDIRQKALKLTANSMYGCLGFSFSRFYAKPLAALITYKGREILMNTKTLVEKLGLEVIYGDTDSIMILTNCVSYDDVRNIGNNVQCEVNRLYKLLEIEIDGVFRSILLLKKKKYAALTVHKAPNGELTYVKEVKGLDIVRRDWSILAKNAGEHILDQILTIDKTSDSIVENIHNYMKTLSESIRNNELPIEEFIISKALTKNPEDYADKKGLCHVSVALRYNELNKGKKLRTGDTVPYVICDDGSNAAPTQRAYHPIELKDNEKLKIDVKYYLSQQIHPVVSRLCDPIDGTDSYILAELLGIESSAPRNHFNQSIMENAFESAESRFDTCKSLILNCIKCSKSIEIRQIFKDRNSFVNGNKETKNRLELTFAKCPHCNHEFRDLEAPQFVIQIHLLIRTFINEFYKKWLICEDKACLYRTRYFTGHITKEGLKCPKCKFANLYPEIHEFQLYHQLCFFKYLFDLDAALKRISSDDDKVTGKLLKDKFGTFYSRFKCVVDSYLQASAYNEIDLTSLFRNIRNKMLNSHK